MLNFLRFGIPIIILLAAAGFGSQFVTDYRNMATQISELKREKGTLDARVLAYRGMIDRRDSAIAYSNCKDKITDWLRHPEKMPSPIPNPFSIPGQ